jgi:hypothetical protein
MKRVSTVVPQAGIVALGTAVLIAMLWEPHLEGRNVNATLFALYFKDPFLAYVYLATVPFFIGLYQAFKLLGYVRQDKMYSREAVHALRILRRCALITAAAIVVAVVFLVVTASSTKEDPAGAVALGIVATLASLATAIATTVFEPVCEV